MTPQGYQTLLKIGAVEPMYQDVRGSFALIGFSGPGKPSFVKQVSDSFTALHCIIGTL